MPPPFFGAIGRSVRPQHFFFFLFCPSAARDLGEAGPHPFSARRFGRESGADAGSLRGRRDSTRDPFSPSPPLFPPWPGALGPGGIRCHGRSSNIWVRIDIRQPTAPCRRKTFPPPPFLPFHHDAPFTEMPNGRASRSLRGKSVVSEDARGESSLLFPPFFFLFSSFWVSRGIDGNRGILELGRVNLGARAFRPPPHPPGSGRESSTSRCARRVPFPFLLSPFFVLSLSEERRREGAGAQPPHVPLFFFLDRGWLENFVYSRAQAGWRWRVTDQGSFRRASKRQGAFSFFPPQQHGGESVACEAFLVSVGEL